MKTTLGLYLFAAALYVLIGCQDEPAGFLQGEKAGFKEVYANAETLPVAAGVDEDAADDPAIWYNSNTPEKTLIIGSNKRGGVGVYNLNGQELYDYKVGRINNVDIAFGVAYKNELIDVVAGSNRSDSTLLLMTVSKSDGALLPAHPSQVLKADVGDVYGLCAYKSFKTGKSFIFMNGKSGRVQQWQLGFDSLGITATVVRTFALPSQVEGMVVDPYSATLYIGEEDQGVWIFDAEPNGASEGKLIATTTAAKNPKIVYDIEGVTIYHKSPKIGYLIISSQGNYSYAVFEKGGEHKYLGSFQVMPNEFDGVEETDGIEAISLPLGSNYPKGAFVVQDGFNYSKANKKETQNFKIIDWQQIEDALGL